MVLSWSSYKMASIMLLSEICHLECVIRSPFSLPKCVSAMLSQFAEKKGEGEKKLGKGCGVSQRWSKIVVGVPRGCFGNNVRSRP